MEKVWRRVGLHSSRKKRDGSGTSHQDVTSASAPPEAEYQNIHTLRTADLIRQRQGEEKSTLRSSYIIRNGDNFILVERRRRRRRRSGTRASSGSRHHTPPVVEEPPRTEQKRRPPARLKIFGIQWPLHSSDSRHTSITRRFCRGRRSREDNELYRSNSFKFERFAREPPADDSQVLVYIYTDHAVLLEGVFIIFGRAGFHIDGFRSYFILSLTQFGLILIFLKMVQDAMHNYWRIPPALARLQMLARGDQLESFSKSYLQLIKSFPPRLDFGGQAATTVVGTVCLLAGNVITLLQLLGLL